MILAQIASFKNPFNGSGIGGGLGSALLMTKCYISLAWSFPFLSRILNVKMAATISLCFSNNPRRVKLNDVYEMESINWSILPLSERGDSGSSMSSPPFSSSSFSAYLTGYYPCSAGFYSVAYGFVYPPSTGA